MKDIKELLEVFEIKPNNISLYEEAFTHPSFNADAKTKHCDYERLEFLGDSVLDFFVAELAFKAHPELNQGSLTKLRASLVSRNGLSNYARKYQFHEYIRVGNSFNLELIKADAILENVFESFIGAIYLDQGLRAVKEIIIKVFYRDIQKYDEEDTIDYKSRLQEAIQSEHRESVTYEVIKETGPSHDKHFVIKVVFDGITLGIGEGSSKKRAEQMAAKEALSKKADK
ncbi:MAG: ribonuclease III [Bacilli bacterium]|nr:ribonuclease III [Bacilli bacterium]